MSDGDKNRIKPLWDRTSGARINIPTEHAHIHDGEAFSVSQSFSIANGGIESCIIFVPTSVFPHLRVFELSASGAPIDLTLIEGPFTIESSGNVLVPQNMNRRSSLVTSVGFTYVASITTVTGSFTDLEYHLIPGAKQAGGSTPNAATEWDLSDGTEYALTVENDSGGVANAGVFLFWYE